MTITHEGRRAVRVAVQIPARIEVMRVLRRDTVLDPDYECVEIPNDMAGEQFDATLGDLSVNGAMLVWSNAPPILSRLAVSFDLPGYGNAIAIGLSSAILN